MSSRTFKVAVVAASVGVSFQGCGGDDQPEPKKTTVVEKVVDKTNEEIHKAAGQGEEVAQQTVQKLASVVEDMVPENMKDAVKKSEKVIEKSLKDAMKSMENQAVEAVENVVDAVDPSENQDETSEVENLEPESRYQKARRVMSDNKAITSVGIVGVGFSAGYGLARMLMDPKYHNQKVQCGTDGGESKNEVYVPGSLKTYTEMPHCAKCQGQVGPASDKKHVLFGDKKCSIKAEMPACSDVGATDKDSDKCECAAPNQWVTGDDKKYFKCVTVTPDQQKKLKTEIFGAEKTEHGFSQDELKLLTQATVPITTTVAHTTPVVIKGKKEVKTSYTTAADGPAEQTVTCEAGKFVNQAGNECITAVARAKELDTNATTVDADGNLTCVSYWNEEEKKCEDASENTTFTITDTTLTCADNHAAPSQTTGVWSCKPMAQVDGKATSITAGVLTCKADNFVIGGKCAEKDASTALAETTLTCTETTKVMDQGTKKCTETFQAKFQETEAFDSKDGATQIKCKSGNVVKLNGDKEFEKCDAASTCNDANADTVEGDKCECTGVFEPVAQGSANKFVCKPKEPNSEKAKTAIFNLSGKELNKTEWEQLGNAGDALQIVGESVEVGIPFWHPLMTLRYVFGNLPWTKNYVDGKILAKEAPNGERVFEYEQA